YGIVAPLLFECRVVSARPIRTRDPEIQLLFVVELALEIHSDRANHNYNSAVASDFRSEVDGAAARGFGRNQHAINAVSAGMPKAQISKFELRRSNRKRSHPRGELYAILTQIQAND